MTAAIASPPLKRFLWKEYRMLRGLWLAVLVLGLLVDWLLSALLAPPVDFSAVRFFVALAAATLYAAGAAAVLFSVEHEEQTYDFLRGLPTTWQPLFVGKLLIATFSAVALAAVLAILGMLPGGFRPPSNIDAENAASILGMAIFEALAWGTLCSLIFKRPLAAALVTLVVGALAVSLAVSAVSTSTVPLNDPASYAGAIPLRLAIVVALFGLSTVVARRWLGRQPAGANTSSVGSLRALIAVRKHDGTTEAGAVQRAATLRPGPMIVRLVWQSWRESWKFLLVPFVLAAVCMVIGFSGGWLYDISVRHEISFPIAAASLFCFLAAAPALLGALAFSADQRRGGVRFLAEHAATPRTIWFSRHIVWFGILVVLLTVVVLSAATLLTTVVQTHLPDYRRYHDEFDPLTYAWDARQLRGAISYGLLAGTTVMTFLWCGALAAYAIGQFCSMLLRSEILSAFTSLVLATLLIPWTIPLVAWDLSGWLFLLPLAIAFLLATWLRAPHWLAGRNSWRSWVWPVTVIVGAISLVSFLLPQVRLDQVRNVPMQFPEQIAAATITPNRTTANKKYEAEATVTADMYLKAANLLSAPIDDNPLARWSIPAFSKEAPSGAHLPGFVAGIDETKIPADQLKDFLAAKRKLTDLMFQQREAALKLAIEASERPACQFKFQLGPTKDNRRYRWSVVDRLQPSPTYEAVSRLLNQLISGSAGGATIDDLFAALRMNRHIAMNQPTAIVVGQLRPERSILAGLTKLIFATELSNAERRKTLEKLQAYFRQNTALEQALLTDRLVIRAIVEGSEPPLILASKPIGTEPYLAFTANELPWERKRALIALDLITGQNLQNALELKNSLSKSAGQGWGLNELRQWYRPYYQPAIWLTQQPAAATSYLVSMEYQLRVPVNELFLEYCHTIAVERATLLQIALVMYRADHKAYPPTLEALVPACLEKLPLDPYALRNFEYRAQGLEKPLGGYGFSTGEMIPSHTPLLWSIGPDNFQLQERVVATSAGDDADVANSRAPTDGATSNPPKQEAEVMYSLESSEWNINYSNLNPREFLFTLPK